MTNYLYLFILAVCLASCTASPTEKARESVTLYLNENLKNKDSYEPGLFTELDTVPHFSSGTALDSCRYLLTHTYKVINSDKEKVEKKIVFFLDTNFKVLKTNIQGINGDYGTLTGNAFWKYNDYVGNKPDAGSHVLLFSLDSAALKQSYEITTDVQGNYTIEKILPGDYLLIVRSGNATDCPEYHLQDLQIYQRQLKQLFGFDLADYDEQISEINKLDSLAGIAITNRSVSASHSLDMYYSLKRESRTKANILISSFPVKFGVKIRLLSGYGRAGDVGIIRIEEGRTSNRISDFGITCI